MFLIHEHEWTGNTVTGVCKKYGVLQVAVNRKKSLIVGIIGAAVKEMVDKFCNTKCASVFCVWYLKHKDTE